MRILQTPARFIPYIGGTEQITYYLSKELVKRGHEVEVICANEPPTGDSIIDGIKVRRLLYIGKIANTNISLSLFKELSREDFDILHTHLPHPWSADISAIVASRKDKPLFLTYHNDIVGRGLNKLIAGIYNFSALKFLLNRSEKVFITHKDYLTNSRFLHPYKEKVIVSPPGVDLDKFRPEDIPSEDKNIIFFLSRLDEFHRYKGLDILLSSIKKVINDLPLKLYVGGEGVLLGYYKRMVNDYGLEDVVKFLGCLRNEELIRYYNMCDVFVLPSISAAQEGFGLVALEAMACKKPVIVSEVVGVAEDVKKEGAGIVVEPKNVNQLSEALRWLLSDAKARQAKGENAYRLVQEKYTWHNHAEIVEREYLAAIR